MRRLDMYFNLLVEPIRRDALNFSASKGWNKYGKSMSLNVAPRVIDVATTETIQALGYGPRLY